MTDVDTAHFGTAPCRGELDVRAITSPAGV
jgi:hypothetical protein